MLLWLSTMSMKLCKSGIVSELSFLLCKMGMTVIPLKIVVQLKKIMYMKFLLNFGFHVNKKH